MKIFITILVIIVNSLTVVSVEKINKKINIIDFEKPVIINTYNDPYSSIYYQQTNGIITIQYNLKRKIQHPYTVINLPLSQFNLNISEYVGIRLQGKGNNYIRFQIACNNTLKEYNHYSTYIRLNPEWTEYTIRFSELMQFWGETVPMDLSQAYGIQIELPIVRNEEKGEFMLDDLMFLKKDKLGDTESLILNDLFPKVNQLGYLPEGNKQFTIPKSTATKKGTFLLIDNKDKVVYQNKLKGPIDDSECTGETVYIGDFSNYKKPGIYKIKVETLNSFPFSISNNVYHKVYQSSVNCFQLIRCGTAVSDIETGMFHASCHLDDKYMEDNPDKERNFTGGWHNAGDFGKWTHTTAFAIAHMLLLLELEQNGTIKKISNSQILLNEILWGLKWLFKMQNDDGNVYHKVDTEPYFAVGLGPDQDTLQRFARPGSKGEIKYSTIDAADFIGVMLMASRIIKDIDPNLSEICKKHALKTLNWWENQHGFGQNDQYFYDPDYLQEHLWAAAEAWLITKDSKYLKKVIRLTKSTTMHFPSWQSPHFFGIIAILQDPDLDNVKRKMLLQYFLKYSNELITKQRKNGYGVPTNKWEYYWGSNHGMMAKGMVFIYSYIFTGKYNYISAAQNQLDYILGRNSLNRSFVTGYGSHPVEHPYHWSELAYKKPIHGWMSPGPNSQVYSQTMGDFHRRILIQRGTPPAKCYADKADELGSWGSNETGIEHQAAFLFITGFFSFKK